MSIFQRGDIWYVDYYEGKKRVKKQIGKRKTDATAYLGKLQAAKRENRLFDMKKEYNHTFDEVLEKYKEVCKGQKTYKDKQYHFPLFEKVFKGKMLAEITLYDLEKFRNERMATPRKSGIEKVREGFKIRDTSPKLPKKRSARDVNAPLETLRNLFNKAVSWDMMEKNPLEKAKGLFLKVQNERVRFLSDREEKSLYKVLESCKAYLMHIVIVALNTGMRKSEILLLKWSQIVKKKNGQSFIYLTETKTYNARQIPVNDTLEELFQSLPRHIESKYVFFKKKDGTPFNDVPGFVTAVRKAGIENFKFHDCRHDFASKMVMKGASIKAVQELLGHKDITMTMRYSHLEEDDKVQAVKLLDKKENREEKNQSSPKTVPNGKIGDRVTPLSS